MLIIAGHIEVDPDDRDEAVAAMRDLVTRAPDAPGRVNTLERWEWQAALETFRGSGPSTK